MLVLGQTPPQTIIAPVIPEDVPLKCRYDVEASAWRCAYPSFWREPAVYTSVIIALSALGLGVLVGSSERFRRVIRKAAALVPG